MTVGLPHMRSGPLRRTRRERGALRAGWPMFAALAAVSLAAAACTTATMPTVQAPAAPAIRQQAELAPGEAREHMRILAAYGGQYDNPRIQAMLDRTVDKLVAASERPDLRYQVTMLNSPAVNAFALPNGQLYVTRGLIALANDQSEVASVMAHEMAHVIARHAAIREDQARQAALVNRVATDLLERSAARRAGARQVEDRARQLLARAGVRGRRHRRRHLGARRLSTPTAPSASSPRWATTRSFARRARSTRARRTSSPRIRRPPSA